MKRSLLLVLLAAAFVPAAVHGQDTEWNRYTLEDLGGVFVRFGVDRPVVGLVARMSLCLARAGTGGSRPSVVTPAVPVAAQT